MSVSKLCVHTVGRVLNVSFFWLRIVSFYTRQSNNRRKKNTQLYVTTPLLHACSLMIPNVHTHRYHACSIYLHPCTYSCLIVENEFSILQANCQSANTIANAKPSATVAQAVLMTHPTCSLISHISIAKIESVAFSFGYLQLIESQSGLYSTIRNRLTMHSKSNLWQW